MTRKGLEITGKLIGEDYKENVEVYSQRLATDYVHTQRPDLVPEIIAVVNGLPMPKAIGSWVDAQT